ncbi:MAG: methionine--tRNA ligase subunit beta [Myxococcales bacterium]|nr:methionine--tRNA ligase subunit beta [Myxococcales bacterium]
MSDGKFYITTPIYYVNFKPHIGTGYTTILTDVACRFQRMCGKQALLTTGSDEHSQNIADLAAEAGVAPRAYCDGIIPKFRDCWELLEIQSYNFERTSDEKHHNLVQRFWQRLYDKGDVYKGEYSGWYHTSDNRYLDPSEVPENPESHPRLKFLREDSYFFRLSAFEDWLLAFHEANPTFVIPDFRRNEMLARIKSGLKDISISRTSTDWGIPLPWDEGHVFYVWIEALLTYMTGSGFDLAAYEKTIGADGVSSEAREPLWQTERSDLATQPETNFWPMDLMVMAKDIPWFHAVIFPAMLKSFGAPLPKQMLVHGYWQFDGEKMSKSLGNVVDPYDAAKIVGADGLRYFLMREVPAGRDGNFNFESLIKRYNFDLANDLGNLVHRTVSLLHQLFEAKVPPAPAGDDELDTQRKKTIDAALAAYEELRYSDALQEIWSLVRLGNQYIDQHKPWELKKKPERRDEIGAVFNRLLQAIKTVVLLASPVIPGAAQRFWQILGLTGTIEDQREAALCEPIAAGHVVAESEPVFVRVDKKVLAAASGGAKDPGAAQAKDKAKANDGNKKDKAKDKAKAKDKVSAEAAPDGPISIDDFAKVQLRVAEILSVEPHPNADKLLKIKVHDGERERQIIAGIAAWYQPDELVGKRIVIVANLKPAKLRGELSEGMLLAADDSDGKLGVLTPDREVAVGARVK